MPRRADRADPLSDCLRFVGGLPRRLALGRLIARAGAASLLIVPLLAGQALAQASLTATVGANVASGPTPPQQVFDTTTYGAYSAIASYGSLVASGTFTISEVGSEGISALNAQFSDRLTVSAPGATTVQGFVTGRIRIDGLPSYTAASLGTGVGQNVTASYQVRRLQGAGTFNVIDGAIGFATNQVPQETTSGTYPPPAFIEVDFPILFGSPSDFGLFLLSVARGGNVLSSGSSEGTITGSSPMSLFWDGIVSIRDANGNELLGTASVTSDSGTDYLVSQAPPPVPFGFWTGPALVLVATGVATRLGRTP